MMEEKKLYTLLVYSENVAGILNQITAVFTRRQVNIESLNVSASSIPGVHKYTITAWSDEDQIIKITRQIEKKIDVVKANYFTDEQLFIRETGLYKLSTEKVLENPEISRTVRRFGASIILKCLIGCNIRSLYRIKRGFSLRGFLRSVQSRRSCALFISLFTRRI